MAVFARKFSRAKWDQAEGLEAKEISADAVTADLRTSDNTLSFWTCSEGDEAAFKDVALALAVTADRVDKMDIAWIYEEELISNKLAIAKTKGITPLWELCDHHRDITKLDVTRLIKVAELLRAAVIKEHCRRLTKKEVSSLIHNAIKEKRVALTDLNEKLRIAITEEMSKTKAS